MRTVILSEIRRLAALNGLPPGKAAFAKATGIAEAKWHGVLWARWGDALIEAGFLPNDMNVRLKTDAVTSSIALLAVEIGHVPTRAEMKMRRRIDDKFPSHGAISNHFPNQAGLIAALHDYGLAEQLHDLVAILPPRPALAAPSTQSLTEGHVYLLKSGDHYKIGRSDNLERRVREVRVAMPQALTLIHSIRTDDPAGIEAYWHRRFADRRANGEWFKLSSEDVRAFTRRSSQ